MPNSAPIPPSRDGPSDPDHFSSTFEGAIRTSFSQLSYTPHTSLLREALSSIKESSLSSTQSPSQRKNEEDAAYQLTRRIENEYVLSGAFDMAIKLLLETSPE